MAFPGAIDRRQRATEAPARLNHMSVRQKITAITVLVSVLSFVIVSLSFAVYDRSLIKAEMMRSLQITAEVVGNNLVAALQFRSYDDATETLASLRSEPSVTSAFVFDRDGFVLARYLRDGVTLDIPAQLPEGVVARFGDDYLEVFQPVTLDGRRIGTISIRSTTEQLTDRTEQYLTAGLVLLVLCVGLSILFSLRLQRAVTDPIQGLVDVTRKITTDKSMSLRAEKTSDDEIGVLIDGFNEMLDQIERQDSELKAAQIELEKRVEERTAQLSSEVEIRREAEQSLKLLAAELETRNTMLTQKNRELDEFTSIASHDLQEPVRKIRMFTSYLVEDFGGNVPEAVQKDLDVVTNAAERMQILIQDLLLFSRTGREALNPERFDMRRPVDLALLNFSEIIREHNAQVDIDDLPDVCGNETLLAQLYQNLIGNALKFIRGREPHLRLTSEIEDGRRIFGVRDNGIGIKKEHCQRIFAPFKRLHGRQEFKGTGIGLALCKRIVEIHGGRIWVESVIDEGSHFRFTLWENLPEPSIEQ